MRNYLSILLCFLSFYAFAQFGDQDPTNWNTTVEKIAENEYVFKTQVTLEPGWHLYSQTGEKGRGPIPTTFSYYGVEDKIELIGVNKEEGSFAEFSSVWDFNVYQFSDKGSFEQRVKILDESLEYIVGEIGYQVCDDEKCLRPTSFSYVYKLNPDVVVPDDATDIIDVYYDEEKEPLLSQGPEPSSIPLMESHDLESKSESDLEASESDTSNKQNDKIENDTEEKSLWAIFLVSFLAGFAALLTPCVFPMIPLTVSFFTKQSSNRAKGISNAILYGFFIILIYVLLGSVVVAIFGDRILNAMSTNAYVNLGFFIILIIFAASFLGAFEITLPQSWANKVDEKSNKGGFIGIFFMALALAIISFSCTGPIVGSLIVEAASKGGVAPIVGMLGFSTALALPFTLFAIFPGWMNSLPKSGGWLNTVKVVLGFLELALAFKFLSNADLVYQFMLLPREVFLAFWIAIFGSLALYLFGRIKMPHDGPESTISVGRALLGVVVLSFTIYMIPGMWGAPLKIISGFPPPLNYAESPYGVGYKKLTEVTEIPEHAHLGVHDIITFDDYDEGLAYAKQVNKPVLVDFTGYACVNCRKMEERVWSDSRILPILKNDFVMISLYVDDQNKLPKEEQYESEVLGGKVRTIGDKWYELQKKQFKNAAQPYYVKLNADGTQIGMPDPVGYTPDINEYRDWLKEGIE